MVSFCCEIFLLCAAALMLTFFIAGLLFICASSTLITWERTPHPVRRPAFSSHLFSTIDDQGELSSDLLLSSRKRIAAGITKSQILTTETRGMAKTQVGMFVEVVCVRINSSRD